MKYSNLLAQFSLGLIIFCCMVMAQAGIPVWSFSPDAGYPPKVSVAPTETATVKYTITNHSSKAHQLAILPQAGVSQVGTCTLPKGVVGATCSLILTISGNTLPVDGISGGPKLCQINSNGQPNPNQCYQPGQADILSVNKVIPTNYIWQQTSGPIGGLVRTITSPPGNPNMLYVAGVGGVFKTTDGGASWNTVNTGLTDSIVPSVFAVDVNTVFVGTASGVFKTTDGGAILRAGTI